MSAPRPLWPWLTLGAVAGAGTLMYGALFETDRLVGERITLPLPDWPSDLDGFTIGLLTDLHVRDAETIALTHVALEWLADQSPDMVVYGGDFISYWNPDVELLLPKALEAAALIKCPQIAVPGNHDFYGGDADNLRPYLDAVGIDYLRNRTVVHHGIAWVGIDSANSGTPDPYSPLIDAHGRPTVVVWHEPDLVDALPRGADLMLSGHSHGGQFVTPWGWAPMRTKNGTKYVRGFFPNSPTPLYVSRGLAVTGPPARLFCRPEVTLLTLCRA